MTARRHVAGRKWIFRIVAGLVLAIIAASRPALADRGFFIGDSIAFSAGQTIGIDGVAWRSVSLRRDTVAEHMKKVPKGAIAMMSLGLNDASDPVKGLRRDIERVIGHAQRSGLRMVWIGPPCVLKRWDNRAKEMDAYLRERLAKTAIQYVSLRDPQICQKKMRTRDGEHFTPSGYRYVWKKIQRDSSLAALVDVAKSAPAGKLASVKRRAEANQRRSAAVDAGKSASVKRARRARTSGRKRRHTVRRKKRSARYSVRRKYSRRRP